MKRQPIFQALKNLNGILISQSSFRFFTISILIIACFSCEQDHDQKDRPNIVWITSEDNSKHYMELFDDNGTKTPNIDSLAGQGILFRHAFSNGPVCSVARSALISGSYGPRTFTQFHRRQVKVPMPDSLKMFPAYLQEAGYHTTNNSKEDYNFIKGKNVWHESSNDATWRNRESGQPFFHVFNIGTTHESRLHFSKEEMDSIPVNTEKNSFSIQPNHPQTELFRYTNAFYRDKIREMDRQVGEVVNELKKDGLLDETFIFYFGDHGGVLPGSKGYIYETGLHIPLVVHIPEKYSHLVDFNRGSSAKGFVSFVDFGPTVLNLAGVEVPEEMDGQPFLGPGVTVEQVNSRDETIGYADRFDEKYDLVRSIRKGDFKYIRNFQPFNFDGLWNFYRYKQLAFLQWRSMHYDGELNEVQSRFYERRTPEMLFKIDEDPYETENLANDPEYRDTLLKLRNRLNKKLVEMPDLSFFPEYHLVNNAAENPVEFGQNHKNKVEKYLSIANLSLSDFSEVKEKIENSLTSSDPFARYWGLITCSTFGQMAKDFEPLIREIAKTDTTLMNRVRAAEYLGISGLGDPSQVMTEALYASRDPVEALLILNTITLMKSPSYDYQFDIELDQLAEKVREQAQVKRRLEFFGVN